MKKSLITLGLLSILTTHSFAGTFFSVGYTQGLEEQTVKDSNGADINFEANQFFKFKFGLHNFPIEEEDSLPDMYFGFGLSKQNEGLNEHRHTVINVGMTHALNNNFVLFGGLGFANETLNYDGQDEDYFTESKLNVNVGGMMYFGESHYGLFAEYDSALNAVGGGISLRF